MGLPPDKRVAQIDETCERSFVVKLPRKLFRPVRLPTGSPDGTACGQRSRVEVELTQRGWRGPDGVWYGVWVKPASPGTRGTGPRRANGLYLSDSLAALQSGAQVAQLGRHREPCGPWGTSLSSSRRGAQISSFSTFAWRRRSLGGIGVLQLGRTRSRRGAPRGPPGTARGRHSSSPRERRRRDRRSPTIVVWTLTSASIGRGASGADRRRARWVFSSCERGPPPSWVLLQQRDGVFFSRLGISWLLWMGDVSNSTIAPVFRRRGRRGRSSRPRPGPSSSPPPSGSRRCWRR